MRGDVRSARQRPSTMRRTHPYPRPHLQPHPYAPSPPPHPHAHPTPTLIAASILPTDGVPPLASAASATGAAPFGCGKCRWSPGGCTRCRADGFVPGPRCACTCDATCTYAHARVHMHADGFVPGPREGRAGGIPQPGSVESSLVVGSLGDGGGLRIAAIVTDDTPICNALRSAGLAAGLGVISQVRIVTVSE